MSDDADRIAKLPRLRMLKNESGPYFEALTRSRDSAFEHLRHSDPRARLGAMLVIKEYWSPPPEIDGESGERTGRPDGLHPIFEALAFEDESPKVRGAALLYLFFWYSNTRDHRITEKLERVLRDESQPNENRYVAYMGMLEVHGLVSELWTGSRRPPDCLTWTPSDVDWWLVNRCLKRKRT